VILISSAAYIGQDLSAEVGLIPPSFLPIGNQRLYEHQISSLHGLDEDIYLSLPASYSLNEADKNQIEQLGANILFVPDNISLGESILYCWNATGKNYSDLKILHGDTLFLGFSPCDGDLVSISHNKGAYERAYVEFNGLGHLTDLHQDWVNDNRFVLSGYFCFSEPQYLMKCIIEAKNSFVDSIKSYSNKYAIFCFKTEQWLDFGHLNSFFTSRTEVTTQRAFNDLKISKRTVTKFSSDLTKMQAESNWFESLPPSLRLFTPSLLQPYLQKENKGLYSIEYLYLLPLSDLLVFGNLSTESWRHIFLSAKNMLNELSGHSSMVDIDPSEFHQLYLQKTLSRLSDFALQTEKEVGSLISMAEESAFFISEPSPELACIIHGDFCFSNILHDSRVGSIKLIDPRGLNGYRELSIYGDKRYDLAKFFHSAIGCYDLIIAGRYFLIDGVIGFYDLDRLDAIEKAFDRVFFDNKEVVSKKELLAINVQLFLSMLPLHHDRPDRQQAMIANAKRLFQKLISMDSL